MKRLLKFDESNFYIGEDIVEDSHETLGNEYLADLDEVISFNKPKLVNSQVVEGKTENEFLEEQLIRSLLPSRKELEEADFEIKIITLLTELEVI